MKKYLLFLVVVSLFGIIYSQETDKTNDEPVRPNVVITPIAFEITSPLRDNPIVEPEDFHDSEFIMNAHRDRKINPDISPPDFDKLPLDTNVQAKAGWVHGSKATIKNFAGQNSGSYPPDCNGTVGHDYYFQVVNTTYAIYDKVTEAIVAGPSNLNSIFNPSLPGATCNNGDPIVLWDEHADRWFYAEFSLCGFTDYMLIAVSQTADPTGSWYSWSYDVDDMPDYMKFGVWQDGYYMATNTGGGNDVYVFERDVMLAGGASPTMIGFDNPNRPSTFDGFHCILPLDNDGTWAPSGTPGQFITIADGGQGNPSDELWIYELNADWITPGNSTFARTQAIPVNSFSGNFNNSWNNIPQQGTGQTLDGLSTILMYRAQYRNFGAAQTIVCAHAIAETSSEAAMRWYELENTGSGWSIRQQNTYNPDNISRWNMSIAMNGSHEIGIGYSVSNSSMYPGIRYIGQSAAANAAANNTLDLAETNIWTGSFSQSGFNRWGDYCNISIDPSDDHTFWYTNEYVAMSTHGTRIVSFQLSAPSPIPVANFFADDVAPVPGQTVTFTDTSTNSPTSWAWVFNPTTVTYVGGTNASSQNPQVTFDAAGLYTVTLTATNADGSDDEIKVDYINVAPCIDPTNLNASGITSTSADLSWTSGTSETLWNIEYGLQGFAQGTGTMDNGVTNPYNLTGLSLNTTYDYYVQADCSNGFTSNWAGPFTFTTLDCSYCASTYTDTSDDWISNVTLGTINNTSGQGGASSYEDFSAISTDLDLGGTYTVSVDVTVNGNWLQHTWLWIDWNQDCDFTDPGESFDLGVTPGTTGTHTLSTNITVPVGALLGTTRMRIIEEYDTDPNSCDPHPNNFGETEDYSVNVLFACAGTTTTWNGASWDNGVPDATKPAIIAGNYTTDASHPSIEACTCEITSGAVFTIAAGYYIEVVGDIDNDGTIIVEHEGSLVQNDETDVNTGTGLYQIHKTTRPYSEYDYTFWSSPVEGETVEDAFINNSTVNSVPNSNGTPGSPPNYIFWLNTSNFNDDNGDTFDDESDDWIVASGTMERAKGYIAMGAGSDFPFNTNFAVGLIQSIYYESDRLNNGSFTYPLLEDNSTTDSFVNENLIGNPYASAIDLQLLRNEPDNNPGGNSVISPTVWFWSHDTAISNGAPGPWAYNFTNADYAVFNIAADTGSAAHSIIPTRYMASCQSILFEANTSGTLHFKNAMRVTGNNDNFIKSENESASKIWLNLSTEDGLYRQLAIVFMEGADDSVNDYDSKRKLFDNETDLYSLAPNHDDRLVIQGLSSFTETKTISLGIDIMDSGEYSIKIDQVEGVFENEQNIYLKDYFVDAFHNLSDEEYLFTVTNSEVGEINNRFELGFIDETLSYHESVFDNLVIYPNPSKNIFKLSGIDMADLKVTVFDPLGKIVNRNTLEKISGTYQIDLTSFAKGVYFATIEANGQRTVRKLALK